MRRASSCLVVALLSFVALAAQRSAAPVTFDVAEKSILELQAAMEAGQVTSRQLLEAYLARIAAYDKDGPALNSIVALNPQAASIAEAMDAERKAGKVRGALHGIPILVKDNFETVEMPTTAGSIALATFHPKSDAFTVRKLRDAGAVIVGKTNMHELAAGITTISSSGGQTRNPYDLGRTPGGSSGGTGASIAASFAAAGMGSDTCGSIRIPAANNNLVGLRGTQGLSSRSGIVPLSSTQDIGGPIARSMTDLAIMLDATVGPDPADAQTRALEGRTLAPFRAGLSPEALKGARIGVLRSYFGNAPEDQEVAGIVQKAIDVMKGAGAEILDVSIPGLDDLLQNSSMIASDFKFDLADYLAKTPGAPVRSLGDILERGLYHAALEQTFRARNAPERRDTDAARRARIKQAALRQVTLAVFEEQRIAAMIYPTLRRRPARIGDAQPGTTCQLSAHTGLPALAVPAGFTDDGVPIGLELLGRDWSDRELVAMGFAYEQVAKPRRPPLSTPPLVNGKAPAARRITTPLGEFSYTPATGVLEYRLAASEPRDAVIWIHRGTPENPAAALHQLRGGAAAAVTGSIRLTYQEREDLLAQRLYVQRHATNGVTALKAILAF